MARPNPSPNPATMIPTPRTENEDKWYFGSNRPGMEIECVSADFARQLEREVQQLNERLIDRASAYEARERDMMQKIRELESRLMAHEPIFNDRRLTPEWPMTKKKALHLLENSPISTGVVGVLLRDGDTGITTIIDESRVRSFHPGYWISIMTPAQSNEESPQ